MVPWLNSWLRRGEQTEGNVPGTAFRANRGRGEWNKNGLEHGGEETLESARDTKGESIQDARTHCPPGHLPSPHLPE